MKCIFNYGRTVTGFPAWIRIFGIFFIFYINAGFARAQAVPDSLILYTPEFRFVEGIFPSFESVMRNNPIPKGRIISEYDYSSSDFFDKVMTAKKVYYFDNLGNKLELDPQSIWGYSRNGFLYVRIDNNFFRITQIGSISHFIAYKTFENYNYNSPYYNPYYNNYPYNYPSRSSSTEMVQYLLDFKTGRIVNYDENGVEVLLMNDPELHTEYVQLSNKKKKQLKFVYIRKFNERNPLYLIKNKP